MRMAVGISLAAGNDGEVGIGGGKKSVACGGRGAVMTDFQNIAPKRGSGEAVEHFGFA